MSWLRGSHIKPVDLLVKIHFKGDSGLRSGKIEYLCDIKILGLWVPSRSPESSTVHIGDIGDGRIAAGHKKNFNWCLAGRGCLVRDLVRCQDFASACLDDCDGFPGVFEISSSYRFGN